jgi:hypothetical protein
VVTPSTVTLTASNIIGDGTTGYLRVDGVLNLPNPYTLSGFGIVMSSLTALSGTTLTVGGSSGAVITHEYNTTAEVHKATITVTSLTIASNGQINVTGRGYSSANGPGLCSNGAAYAGESGACSGDTYGSYSAPTNLGSGSGQQPGGGAVILNITNTLTVNGSILADGLGGSNYTSAGGSIFITANALSGSGVLDASAGGSAGVDGGGGGRIAVLASTAGWTGTITAYGGSTGGAAGGAAGTIFLQASGAQGTLVINNNGSASTHLTYLGTPSTTGNYSFASFQFLGKSSTTFVSFSTVTISSTGNVFGDGDFTSTATVNGNLYGGFLSNVTASALTAKWGTTPNASSQTYTLDASTSSNYAAPLISSTTANRNAALSTLTGGTTYYLRVRPGGYVIATGIPNNWAILGSTCTLSQSLPSSPLITNVYVSSLTTAWGAASGAAGYEMDASTISNFSGTLISSVSNSVSITTLTFNIGQLAPNTTYFVRVGSLASGTTAYTNTTPSSTSTLTSLLSSVNIYQVNQTSITMNWTAFAVGPGTNTAEGYELDVSSNANFTPLWDSSITTSVSVSTLTVGLGTALSPYTTYYLRAGGYNFNNVVNYVTSQSTQTLVGAAPGLPSFTAVYLSTLTVTYSTAATANSQGYELDASTSNTFLGTVYSTSTTSPSLNTLTVSSATNLAPNTTYFVRIGALYNGTTNYNGTYPSTSTLASLLSSVKIYQVNQTSITMNWTAWASTGPGVNTSQGYELDVSSTNFNGTGTIYMSSNTTPTTSTLTVTGLANSTTYYLRTGGYNYNAVANFVSAGSTITLSGGPAAVTNLTATAQSNGNVNVTWSAPLDTAYNPLGSGSQFAIEWATYTVVWSTSNANDTFSTDTWHVYIATSGVNPGDSETYISTALAGNVTYNFELWTQDPGGYWSPISNSTSATVTPVLSIQVSSTAYNFGTVNLAATTVSTNSVVITNQGNVTETYSLAVATTGALSVWNVGISTPTSFNTFVLFGAFNASQPSSTTFTMADIMPSTSTASSGTQFTINGSQTGLSVPANLTRQLWFLLDMPLTVSTTNQEQMNVTVTATTP